MAKDVLVLAEQRNGELDSITYELLLRGRGVADRRGVKLNAIILGHHLDQLAVTLANAGVDNVFVADDAVLKDYSPETYCKVISDVARDFKSEFLLMGHTSLGIEMAPAVATRLGATLVTNCTELELSNGIITVTRPMYSGTVHTRVDVIGKLPCVISFEKGTSAEGESLSRQALIRTLPIEFQGFVFLSKVIGLRQPAVGEIDVTEADIIVAAGRGIRGAEHVGHGDRNFARATGANGIYLDAQGLGRFSGGQRINLPGVVHTIG